jgi:hypothetical protein
MTHMQRNAVWLLAIRHFGCLKFFSSPPGPKSHWGQAQLGEAQPPRHDSRCDSVPSRRAVGPNMLHDGCCPPSPLSRRSLGAFLLFPWGFPLRHRVRPLERPSGCRRRRSRLK